MLRHVKAELRSGRVITEAKQTPGRVLRPHLGEKVSPLWGLKFPGALGTRKGIAADSQHKTALGIALDGF